MSFDDLAGRVSGSMSRVFGDLHTYTRSGRGSTDIQVVIRKDVEMLDEHEQVVARVITARLNRGDLSYVPLRDDTISRHGVTYTVGRTLKDDGYSYLLEVTS